MRTAAQTNLWEYFIPGWNLLLGGRDFIQGNPLGALNKLTGQENSNDSLVNAANSLSSSAYLEDRAHTEMREDTAYQRAVADMRAAGLNPYTIGGTPANSSSSSANADLVSQKLQILGYLLDLKNLDAKNRKITNDAIGDILGFVKKK